MQVNIRKVIRASKGKNLLKSNRRVGSSKKLAKRKMSKASRNLKGKMGLMQKKVEEAPVHKTPSQSITTLTPRRGRRITMDAFDFPEDSPIAQKTAPPSEPRSKSAAAKAADSTDMTTSKRPSKANTYVSDFTNDRDDDVVEKIAASATSSKHSRRRSSGGDQSVPQQERQYQRVKKILTRTKGKITEEAKKAMTEKVKRTLAGSLHSREN